MEIEHKWGFGMAPIKADVQAKRRRSVEAVLELVTSSSSPSEVQAEDLSTVKGLFSRAHKQDQWDWFTVWRQLGRPGRGRALRTAQYLYEVRRSISDPAGAATLSTMWLRLREERLQDHLGAFLSGKAPAAEGLGYVYVLSTRENPDLLKVGYTTRDVDDRVKEINAATGVVVPYGVRGLWVVRDAGIAEARVHEALAEHRVRRDREFFRLEFDEAARVITRVIHQLRAEV